MLVQSELMMCVGVRAAGMAHEMNNAQAGMIQNVQVIQRRLTEFLPKNIEIAKECGISLEAVSLYMKKRDLPEMFESIMDSGHRAATIVDNMIGFSRKSESIFEFHDLRKLLDSSVELAATDYDLKSSYDFRHIEIIREYDDSIPMVKCESIEIQQVFLNLLTNAAHATAARNRKSFKPEIRLRVTSNNKTVRVEIEDNGHGFDEETRKRVFEPFFTTKNVGEGTGLGLYVSYFIITEKHDGAMEVESTPGEGAKFIITIPIEREPN